MGLGMTNGVRGFGLLVLAVCAAGLGTTERAAGQYTAMQVASGLNLPVFVANAPGDYKRVFVVTKPGRIRVLDETTNPYVLQPFSAPFLDLTALIPTITDPNDERGLLGLAFHPQFQTNGKLYVYYTANPVGGLPNSATYYCTVAEYTVRDPGTLVVNSALNAADPASARIIMQIPHPQSNHNGGWIGFGPDGYLYIAVGDGGGANDTGSGHNPTIGNGQDTGVPLGKMMRIDINVTTTPAQGPFVAGSIASYGIPTDNPTIPTPMGATGSRREIWAYGLRNPYRDSFDRATGDLWIGDVGQGSWEEVNFQPAVAAGDPGQVGGRNYGWRCKEAFDTFNSNGGKCTGLNFTIPTAIYSHGQFVASPPPQQITALTGCAIVGGYVYRGCAVPALAGKYIFGDYCMGRVYALTASAGVLGSATEITGALGVNLANTLVAFGEDRYGELYICDEMGGRVLKIVPTGAGVVPLGNCDFNRSGVVTVQDIFDYLAAFFGSSASSDFNGAGGVTVQDIFDFLGCWFRGCQG